MPHWDDDGNQQWVCQRGAHICTGPSTWVEGEGNVCPSCLDKPKHQKQPPKPPMSMFEHCRRESGLSGNALRQYVNRHYGFG